MLDLSRALRDQLVHDPVLTGLLADYNGEPAVFDYEAPEQAAFPYVVCSGSISDVPFDSKTRGGRDVLRQVAVWAKRTGSTLEVDTIAERVRRALHHGQVWVQEFDVVEVRVAGGPIAQDDEDAYGRVLQVRLLLAEA